MDVGTSKSYSKDIFVTSTPFVWSLNPTLSHIFFKELILGKLQFFGNQIFLQPLKFLIFDLRTDLFQIKLDVE